MSSEAPDTNALNAKQMTEAAWVEVIQQMEQVYSNLISYQVELEQKNRELEEVNQLISSVQRAMTEVLLVTDLSGKVIQHNSSLEQVTGLDAAQISGMDVYSLFAPEDQTVLSLIKQHKEFSQKEVTLCHPVEELPLVINCKLE